MTIPLWAYFGLLVAIISSAQMLLTERVHAAPLAIAFWSKVACALACLPFVILFGMPRNAYFYELLAAQAIMWVISDVIWTRGIKKSGAAIIARIAPMGAIAGFFLWFAVDWQAAHNYLAHPGFSLSVIGTLCLLAFCAWHMKKCAISMDALRGIWFCILAGIIGMTCNKYIMQQVDVTHGVYSYIFFEACIMLTMWTGYIFIKQPLPRHEIFSLPAAKAGLCVGSAAVCSVTATLLAVSYADNPAYVSALRHSNVAILYFIARMQGKKPQGNVWAGFGIVACAAALVILKSQN